MLSSGPCACMWGPTPSDLTVSAAAPVINKSEERNKHNSKWQQNSFKARNELKLVHTSEVNIYFT